MIVETTSSAIAVQFYQCPVLGSHDHVDILEWDLHFSLVLPSKVGKNKYEIIWV